MTDSIERLRTIVRLRRRDVERAEQAIAAHRPTLTAAQMEAEAATAACSAATRAAELARATRAARPADPLARLHCAAAADRAARARDLLAAAGTRRDDAVRHAGRLRQEALRAHARHDAVRDELARAEKQRRRRIERRRDDEITGRAGAAA